MEVQPRSAATFARQRVSRTITDAKGGLRLREILIDTTTTSTATAEETKDNQRQSPSVIARLMSRSRGYRVFDNPTFLSPVTTRNEVIGERRMDQIPVIKSNQTHSSQSRKNHRGNINSNNQRRMVEKRSYYNTADFFPPDVAVKQQQQQQNQAVTIYGEIERRLRIGGIDEPSKDLETLKQILDALQLKGLLHSSSATSNARNQRQNRRLDDGSESPVVLMRTARPPANNNNCRRNVNNSSTSGDSPRRERLARSPGRNENRSSSPVVGRKGCLLCVETDWRMCDIHAVLACTCCLLAFSANS